MLKEYGCADNINIDFSIINDMSYYNGIVFKGYVEGIPSNILSGDMINYCISSVKMQAQ